MLHPTPHEYEYEEPIVELRGVTSGYGGSPALESVDLAVNRGDFVGLLGPSGSGKTTLLRTILGAVDVYEGDVVVEGQSIADQRPRIGYVPQIETIDWNFPVTVEQVVMMGFTSNRWWLPWRQKNDYEHALEIMDRLGIADFARRHIRELSGGQQQRTFLARALVGSPHVLLLDEPTSGVDIKTRDEVMHLLDELNHQDVTIIMTTHEINSVAAHLPWVVCVNRRIVDSGPPSRIFTPEVLKRTYNADIVVTEYMGMKLVAETPHVFGRNGNGRSDSHHVHSHDERRA
ncbi:MAG: metal ABC transporter ATP-binding protein [Dehalococcoidia bacterium]|nr:metal ABC transporter ATP-binding protein [Dehalococcoidia bacterium]